MRRDTCLRAKQNCRIEARSTFNAAGAENQTEQKKPACCWIDVIAVQTVQITQPKRLQATSGWLFDRFQTLAHSQL